MTIVSTARQGGKPPADLVTVVTLFPSKTVTQGHHQELAFGDLARLFAATGTSPAKDKLPMVRLAVSAGNSCASGTPLLEATGVMGDYDGGVVAVREAVERLEAAEIRAIIYTTASHTLDRPRWRVVAPLTSPINPDEYDGLVSLLNGALGGILASESWQVSRRYFYGRVADAPFECATTEGMPLNVVQLAASFDPIGPPAHDGGATPERARVPAVADDFDRRIVLDRADDEVLADVASALELLDADDYNGWVDAGLALKSLAQAGHEEEAHDLWHSLSSKSLKYDFDQAEAKWSTFNPESITYRSLFEWAQAKGWRNPRAAMLETERERSMRIGREGEHRVPVQRVMSGTEMLEEMIFIEEGSRVSFIAEPRYTLPFSEFKAAFAASVDVTKSPTGKKSAVHRAQQWLAHAERKSVRTQTFAPGRGAICVSPENVLAQNLWVARVEKVPTNWREIAQPFFDHVDYLVPDASERCRFLDWLAHIEQQPGQLPSTHYLLIAKQTGIGRNWLAYALARTFAGHVALGFDLGEALRSGFNGALSETLLAVVDELHEGVPGSHNRPIAEKLKSMLTEATRRINPKYGRQRVEFNCCRFLMFSNHEAALPLAENDRRIVVLENPSERRSADYYAKLYALLDAPGFGAALGKALADRNISAFNPGEVAPMSAAKTRTIRAGRTEVEQAVRDVAREWPSDCITSGRLTLEVSQALGGKSWSIQAFAVAAGLVKFAARVKVDGIAVHVWLVRNAADWMSAAPAAVAGEVLRGESEDNLKDFA